MQARAAILCSLLAVFLACGGTAEAQPARRPNIILIMADDLGYECIGANGGTSYETPVLDELAATGMRFEHCYSQPLCTPSRVQIMTGLYNQRNYIRFGLLDPQATTFAHVLKDAGYATCVVGKWQLEGGFEGPQRFGFDEYCLWQLTRRPDRYANPGLEINGKEVDFSNGEYGPDIVSNYLCNFIERNKDRPFLAYYPMILTHSPFVPTPDSDDWDPEARGEGKRKSQPKHFADMVNYMDKTIGKIVAKLEEHDLRENTLILFTGDNGTGRGITSRMGDRDVEGGKGMMTDAGTRAPLIVNWPGTIPPGQVTQELVDFTDFLPTFADAAGAKLPPSLRPDGRSFLPFLRGEQGTSRQWIYCWYSRDGKPPAQEWARDQRYKLYRGGEFFDVSKDPLEKKPLPADQLTAEASAARSKLADVLEGFENTRTIASGPEAAPQRPRRRARP